MSLVGSLLTLIVLAAIGTWIAGVLWVPALHPGGLWREITAPLRERHAALPALTFAGLWFVGLVLAVALSAPWALMGLLAGVPAALIYDYGSRGLSGLLSHEHEPDGETFALPIDVYETAAEDVSGADSAVPIPRRTLLTLGASGSGKSETLKHIVDQLRTDPDDPVVVFDMKTDYQDYLADRGVPMIRLSASGSDATWNVFAELDRERDADEIARALIPADDGDFFGTAARQVFAATLKYLDRELGEHADNAELVEFWRGADVETLHGNLREHDDLTAAAAAIDPDASRQAQGVFATAQQAVSDLFVGDFADAGDFSVRDYMDDPDGRVLVLDHPAREGATVGPVFRFLIDESIKHGMAAPERPCYYLLDEIEHLSAPLRRLGELINVGRGNACQAILSLQSVAQLQDTYGRERASALLSGMTTSIILRCGDAESVDYARETIGTHFEEYTGHVDRKRDLITGRQVETGRETRLSEQHAFAKGDLRSFEAGEAVICRQGAGWVHGRVRLIDG